MTETVEAPQVESTEPGTAAESQTAEQKPTRRKRMKKSERVTYPGLQPTAEHPKGSVKLKEAPSDFNPAKHNMLKSTDFEDEAIYLDWRAELYERKAKSMRAEAAKLRKFGSTEERAKVKKLLDMQSKMAELQKQLEAEGISLDDLS